MKGKYTYNKMEEQKHNKITFIFGAGAEGNDYDISNGADFKKDIVKCTNIKEMFELVNKKDDKKYASLNNGLLIRYNSKSTLYQTIKENNFSTENKEIQTIIDNYIKYKEGTIIENETKKEYSEKFQKLFKENIYDKLKNEELDGELIKFYLDKLSFCSFVDSLFNYLRDSDNYHKECIRVMKLYFSAYASIISCLTESWDKCKNDDTIINKRKEMLNIIEDATRKKISNVSKDTYYRTIKEKLEKFKIKGDDNNYYSIKIITTNYTSICQEELELKDDYFAYIHGKLNLFENLKTKEIKNLMDFEENDIVFPYLMIQSGIKPIISPYQIKTWNRAIEFLENSECIFILGYGFNSDDEHLHTIIRDSINNEVKIVIFLYLKDIKDLAEEKNRIKNKFGTKGKNILFFKTEEFASVLTDFTQNKELISSI